MERGKDGVTLIADAIRKEEEEKAKQTVNKTAVNVSDVTAQFSNRSLTPETTKATTPATPETSNDDTDDGTNTDGNTTP